MIFVINVKVIVFGIRVSVIVNLDNILFFIECCEKEGNLNMGKIVFCICVVYEWWVWSELSCLI